MSKIPIAFFGTPQFSVPVLEQLTKIPEFKVVAVFTKEDRPAGRGNKIQAPPVKTIAESLNIPIFQPLKLKNEISSISKIFAELSIQAAVVIAYGQIIPIEILDLCQGKFINVHASLLPKYRGAAPIQRAIMNGETETGVCLMQMEAGLDTGSVFSKATCNILDHDSYGDLHDRLSALSAKIIKDDFFRIISGELSSIAQNSSEATYADKILNDDAKINWKLEANKVLNQIRALSPSPGAFSTYLGKRVKIFKAIKSPLQATKSGVISISANDLYIDCLDFKLQILELQIEGRKKLSTLEFLKGFELRSGVELE